jgi:hypothetical protein
MTEPKAARTDEMPATELTFRVGMALGRALSQPAPTIPTLARGQRVIQMWSEPDSLGYRYLLTFELSR